MRGWGSSTRSPLFLLLLSVVFCDEKALRPFESGKVELLGADVCWEKRQYEKEAFENLRMEHLECIAGKAKRCPPITGGSAVPMPQPLHARKRGQAPPNPDDLARGVCEVVDPTTAPVKDRKTGLCTWRAFGNFQHGSWMPRDKALRYLGLRAFKDYGDQAVPTKESCSGKKWYHCPAFAHSKEWVPEMVRKRQCAMTYMTPDLLRNITGGRSLRVLLHGSSFFKATYRAFLCLMDEWVEWEEHHRLHDSAGAEAWVAQIGPALTVQNVYRDYTFNATSPLVPSSRLLDLDEFDVIVTNFGGSGSAVNTYTKIATALGYSGPIVFTGNPCARCCARCKTDDELYSGLRECSTNGARSYECARRNAMIPINFCELSLPVGGYRAQWAPGGKVGQPPRRALPNSAPPAISLFAAAPHSSRRAHLGRARPARCRAHV